MDLGEATEDHNVPPAGEGHDYAEDGVDVTLIRWMLSMTPTRRLRILQQNVQSLRRLVDESHFT